MAGRIDDLRPEQRQQLAALAGHVVGQHDRHPVALATRDHGQRDAGVAAGRLEDDGVGTQPAAGLEVLDERLAPRGP